MEFLTTVTGSYPRQQTQKDTLRKSSVDEQEALEMIKWATQEQTNLGLDIITDGEGGNGPANFSFQGTFMDHNGVLITPNDSVVLTTVNSASNGGEQEDVSSIKYFAPRLYSAQYRAVTSRDYEAIISSIYPKTESVAGIGGEELDPPQFGKVQISIKPKNGTYVSDFDKQQIKSKLKSYAIAGINSEIIDLKVIYVELHSTVYYDSAKVVDHLNLKSSKPYLINMLESLLELIII